LYCVKRGRYPAWDRTFRYALCYGDSCYFYTKIELPLQKVHHAMLTLKLAQEKTQQARTPKKISRTARFADL
jgi:hypothetical protein